MCSVTLCASTLKLSGCCQRENLQLQVPSLLGSDWVEVTACVCWHPRPSAPALLSITANHSVSQALLTSACGSRSSQRRAQPEPPREGRSVIASTLHNGGPFECLKSSTLTIFNPALKTVLKRNTLWSHQYFINAIPNIEIDSLPLAPLLKPNFSVRSSQL